MLRDGLILKPLYSLYVLHYDYVLIASNGYSICQKPTTYQRHINDISTSNTKCYLSALNKSLQN